jgi:glutamyl-tRNA synthetase
MKVRFAPSPTGNLHLGSARVALYNKIFAQQHGGEYHLRIEDTDRERSTSESEKAVLRALDWLDLGSDQMIIRQSERGDVYQRYIDILRDNGFLYEDDGALRGRIEGEIFFHDRLHGDMRFHGDNVRDPVLVRSNGTPTYNLAAAIDDGDTGITHIIRGDDHLSNTPIQVAILNALHMPVPEYAHLPMILGPDGKKLSKRHGAVSVEEYSHYLPEAIRHYLGLLGGAIHDVNDPVDDILPVFELEKAGKSAAQYDIKALDNLQTAYMLRMSKEDWLDKWSKWNSVSNADLDPDTIYYLAGDKAKTWDHVNTLIRPLARDHHHDADLPWADLNTEWYHQAMEGLRGLESWDEDSISQRLRELCKEAGLKPRVALPQLQWSIMGQRYGTSLFRVLNLLGREESLSRLRDGLLMHAKTLDGPEPESLPNLEP